MYAVSNTSPGRFASCHSSWLFGAESSSTTVRSSGEVTVTGAPSAVLSDAGPSAALSESTTSAAVSLLPEAKLTPSRIVKV